MKTVRSGDLPAKNSSLGKSRIETPAQTFETQDCPWYKFYSQSREELMLQLRQLEIKPWLLPLSLQFLSFLDLIQLVLSIHTEEGSLPRQVYRFKY